ncbi:MAG: hypothetical protein VXZ35_00660 [Pseudomonadota bacterium]|nr:hypothetical protein [Pseudomonadota bacterium]
MIKRLLVVFALLWLAGCATSGSSNKLSSLQGRGALPEDTGVLLVSAGRGPSGGFMQLPFVSYGVYLERSETQMEKIAFLPAEAGFINQLGKNKYGFVHLRELKAGRYYLVGQKGRGNALDNPLGVFVVVPAGAVHYDSNGKKLGISIQFDVEPGKVNYLGEVLTVSKELTSESIKITDQSARDYSIAKKQYPELEGLEFTKVQAKKI